MCFDAPISARFEGLDRAGGYVYYIKAFGWGIGWPMLVLACVGIVWAVVRREWPLLIVASLPVCLYLVMGTSHMYAARFMLPGVPALIVLTAIVINDVGTRALLPAALLAGLVLVGTLPATLHLTHSLPVPIREPRRDRGSRRMCRPAHAWLQKHRRSVHLSRICLWILSPRGTMLSTTSRWRVIARRASGISSRADTRQRPRISILSATRTGLSSMRRCSATRNSLLSSDRMPALSLTCLRPHLRAIRLPGAVRSTGSDDQSVSSRERNGACAVKVSLRRISLLLPFRSRAALSLVRPVGQLPRGPRPRAAR